MSIMYNLMKSHIQSNLITVENIKCSAMQLFLSQYGEIKVILWTGVGCCALLQEIFLTQESNLHLLPLPALAGRFFTTGTIWKAHKDK